MKRLLVLFLIGLIINGCDISRNEKTETGDNIMNHENVKIKTEDDINLAGDYYKGGEKGIILLHMLSMTKRSWEDFAIELQKNGYSVFAIDLRGHGQSDLNFRDFTEKEFDDMIKDVKAAKKFLDKKENVVMGASIGANLAIKFANEVNGVVALSPAFNYRGIKTEDEAKNINKPVLIVVSEEDRQSVGDSKELNNIIKGSVLKVYKGKGHGTNMLDRETKDLILNWIGENF